MATARPLGDAKDGLIGWSSGHHPHRTSPESWATATAFRFLQGIRRLVGLEVRERAGQLLQARRPKHDAGVLADRGQTWDAGQGEVGSVLSRGLVAPIVDSQKIADGYLDPDRPRVPEEVPRSAILYGPPGTGKTTIAESVAGALGWSFVEVTSADFLSQGSDQVSARADEIFRQLMELDEVVVLFDEVDELIRSRSQAGEMAGRFFTTTMLPRLARLWDRRRTVFFLNTNGIDNVDPAVQRSQRFDAALLVLPPSFAKKVDMLDSAAKAFVDADHISRILDDNCSGEIGFEETREAWFAFLRYDQLKLIKSGDCATRETFIERLVEFGRDLPSDWELAGDGSAIEDEVKAGKLSKDDAALKYVIQAFNQERAHQRQDSTFIAQLEAVSAITR